MTCAGGGGERSRGGLAWPGSPLLIAVWLAAAACTGLAKIGLADSLIRVTAGDHPGFGRIVLDAPGLDYTTARDGGHLLIRFAGDPVLGELPASPRNVLALRPAPGGVELTVPPDAGVHVSRLGRKIVIDIDDSAPDRPAVARTPGGHDPPGHDPTGHDPTGHDSTGHDPPAPLTQPPPAASDRRQASARPSAARPAPMPPAVAATAARADPGPQAKTLNPEPRREDTAAAPAGPAGPAVNPPSPPVNQAVATPPPIAKAPVTQTPASQTATAQTPAAQTPAAQIPQPQITATQTTASQTGDTSKPAVAPANTAQTQHGSEIAPAVDEGAGNAPPPETQQAPPPSAPEAHRDDPTDESGSSLAPVQVWPVTGAAVPSGPVALVAVQSRPPAGLPGAAAVIPFGNQVGGALFSRGPDTYAVFDERRPIDLAALRDDPVFGSAVVTIYPAATLIRLTRRPGQSAILSPARSGWRLSLVDATPRPAALTAAATGDGLTFAARDPGQVVAIADPRTGQTLLVGTQRAAGQGVLTERRAAEFILPVTGQGIVVEPLSDAIGLRITQAGFFLSGLPDGLALSPPEPIGDAAMEAARLTRLFEFPGQTLETLASRERRQAIGAATTPSLQRGPKRRELAQTMLGLGMDAEAQTLLRIAMKDDPREAASPVTIGLGAIAALLAGRPAEAADLDDPRLNGTDEVALWRALRTAMADEGAPAAAAMLAATAPLLLTYPDELRRRVLPLALETMILGGQKDAAARLLSRLPNEPGPAYAKALLKQAQGDNDAALKLLDAVEASRSQLDHARAAIRATELRLAMGQLDTKAAADALEARLFAWRGGKRELALRLRIAELRAKDSEWRAAFTGLREARADFPAQAAEIDRRLKDAFAAVPRDPALDKMPPADLIALLEENAELMADGPEGEPMRILLADKLMALDLPKRADPLLTTLMRAAPIGPARAAFGATLATLRLREGDGDGAVVALSESSSSDMDDAVRDRRTLIAARVAAKRGDLNGAVETLTASQAPAADEERATLLEQAGDWAGARDTLATLVSRAVPDPCGADCGPLDETRLGLVLRLATAATRAGDEATLAALRDRLLPRVGAGPRADMFRLLTARPVRGTADLGRARAEIGVARAVTADMAPKKPASKTP